MSEESQPLRLALLGCGFAARLHGKTLSKLRGEVRTSFASRELARAKEACRRWGGERAFGSYAEAIASDEIDAVMVLTPPARHLEDTLAALDAGKHVIVEKPAFLSDADFDAVEQAAAAAGRRVLVAENYYYKPLRKRLAKLLADGVIGDLLFVHLNAIKRQQTGDWRDQAEEAGGGALFEGGVHWINFLANLGPRVERVHGVAPGSAGGEVERSMLVTVEYAGGGVAALSYSWEVPSPLRGLRISRIFGRSGTITFESNGIFCAVYGKKKRFMLPGLRDIQGYKGMFRDFLAALRADEEPEMTLAMARADMRLIAEAYRTAGVAGDEPAAGASAHGSEPR